MNNIGQGLVIMVIGLGATFMALTIFIGVMLLLQRFFPAQKEADLTEQEIVERQTTNTLARDTSEEEIAVAITLALAHLYSHHLRQNNLGKSLETGPGPWWMAGQLEQHNVKVVEIQGSN